MKRMIAAATLSALLVAHPAAAWWADDEGPDEGWWDGPAWEEPAWEPPSWESPSWEAPTWEPPAWEPPVAADPPDAAPAYEPIAPEPPAREPANDPVERDPVRERPVREPVEIEREPAHEPVPAVDRNTRAAELGLHSVNEVAIANTKTTNGLKTTYETTSELADPGTYASAGRRISRNEASGVDDALWNGRMRDSNGELVAGYVYENFVWNGHEMVHDKWVFFQDDSEIGQLPVEPPIPTSPVAIEAPPWIPPPPVAEAAPPPAGPPAVPDADPLAPQPRDREDPHVPATPAPIVVPPAASVAPRAVRAAIALAPQADELGRIEVLRGRRIRLWTRAFVDGAPGTVTAWHLRSGEVTALGPLSGNGDDPLVAMWERITLPADAFIVSLDVTVSVPGEGARTVPANIAVVVRSPAIVE